MTDKTIEKLATAIADDIIIVSKSDKPLNGDVVQFFPVSDDKEELPFVEAFYSYGTYTDYVSRGDYRILLRNNKSVIQEG